MPKESRIIAQAVDLFDAAGAVRTRIKLLPIGPFKLRDGRGPFVIEDKAHAQQIVDATLALAGHQQIPVDYDHQLEFAAKPGTGGTAPASGWMKNITATDDGIWADVEWTAAAQAKLEAREYRYISPVFGSDKESGRIARLHNAALTNQPAIDGLPAIAAQVNPEGPHMDREKLALALGLGKDATEAQIEAAIADLAQTKVTATTHHTSITAALGLKPEATAEQVIAAAQAKKPDPAKFVPIEGMQAMQAQLDELNEDRAVAAVDKFTEEGRITPALRDWAIDLYKTNRAGFDAYVEKTTPVINGGGEKKPKTPVITDALNDEEKQLCSTFGWDEAAFLEQKKKDAA